MLSLILLFVFILVLAAWFVQLCEWAASDKWPTGKQRKQDRDASGWTYN